MGAVPTLGPVDVGALEAELFFAGGGIFKISPENQIKRLCCQVSSESSYQ